MMEMEFHIRNGSPALSRGPLVVAESLTKLAEARGAPSGVGWRDGKESLVFRLLRPVYDERAKIVHDVWYEFIMRVEAIAKAKEEAK